MNKKKFWIVNTINVTTAQILIYGYISPYDISAADFLVELTALAQRFTNIQIRINSGGGSVFEGIAIRSAIKTFIKAGINITTWVDGVAASMGAVLAISGNKVYIGKYARMMFHQASAYAEGSAEEIRRAADMVEQAENDIIKMVMEKSGMTEEEVRSSLIKPGDQWLTAQQCIDMKLADEIFDAEEVSVPENTKGAKELVNLFDQVLNKQTDFKPQNSTMKKDLLAKLGLPENATQEQIDAAVEAQITGRQTAETALQNNSTQQINSMLDQAVAEKKILAGEKEAFVKNFAGNVEGLRMALAKIPAAQKPTNVIKPERSAAGADELDEDEVAVDVKNVKTFDDLKKLGMDAVEKCKKETPDVYNKLYKDQYKRDPRQMGTFKP